MEGQCLAGCDLFWYYKAPTREDTVYIFIESEKIIILKFHSDRRVEMKPKNIKTENRIKKNNETNNSGTKNFEAETIETKILNSEILKIIL